MSEHFSSRSNRESTRNDPPRLGNPPPFDLLSGPRLSCETGDEFIMWAASVPISHLDVIRQRISKCHGDDKIVDWLLDELWKLPVMDVSRHGVILSILGELRNERAQDSLEKFIWYERELTTSAPHSEDRRPCMFESSGTELLQSRAVEMLSYLATKGAAKATLKIARSHPKLAVRAAAIDSHMFNHGDSREVAVELRKVVRASDRALVGLPRKVRGGDVKEFERAVFDWYERNPEHRPPRPKHNQDYPPRPRSWFKKQNDNDGHEV